MPVAARRIQPKDDEFVERKTFRLLGDQIRAYASEQGLELQEIAQYMGVTKSFLSQIMKRGGTIAQVEAIAIALKVSPWKFDTYHTLTFEKRVMAGDEDALLVALTLIESKKSAKRDKVVAALRKLIEEN